MNHSPRNSNFLAVTAVIAVLLSAATCRAGIVNASFETGGLTGWDAMPADRMIVVSGPASDGTHYLTADIEWTFINEGEAVGLGGWHWQAGCWQKIALPAEATTLSVDIRAVGCDFARCGVLLSGVDPLGNLGPIVGAPTYAMATAPADNGFIRYTIDVSALAAYDDVSISITAWDNAETIPSGPVEFSVDNFQFAPEPATILVFVAGLGILLCRRPLRNELRKPESAI